MKKDGKHGRKVGRKKFLKHSRNFAKTLGKLETLGNSRKIVKIVGRICEFLKSFPSLHNNLMLNTLIKPRNMNYATETTTQTTHKLQDKFSIITQINVSCYFMHCSQISS